MFWWFMTHKIWKVNKTRFKKQIKNLKCVLVLNVDPGNEIPTEHEASSFLHGQNDRSKKKTNNFKLSTELVKYFPEVAMKRQESWISIKVFQCLTSTMHERCNQIMEILDLRVLLSPIQEVSQQSSDHGLKADYGGVVTSCDDLTEAQKSRQGRRSPADAADRCSAASLQSQHNPTKRLRLSEEVKRRLLDLSVGFCLPGPVSSSS